MTPVQPVRGTQSLLGEDADRLAAVISAFDRVRRLYGFRRVEVPTSSGHPSISIPLWVANASGRYIVRSGSMRFVYGFIAGDGTRRFGWMALDALETSTGCP